MRTYGIVAMAFWTDEKIVGLSAHGQVLALYLLTGPHSNLAGCIRIPTHYVVGDLKWTPELVDKTFNELISIGFINRCPNSSVTLVKHYLRYNKPENPNQWKAVEQIFCAVPARIRDVLDFEGCLKPFRERLPNCFGIQEQEQEQDKISDTNVSSPLFALIPDLPISDPIPEAVKAWNDLAAKHGLAKVARLTDPRRAKLRLRLDEAGGLDGWRAALAKIATEPWLRGDNDRGWKADFDFLIQASSFTKLMEGSYDRKLNPAVPSKPGKPTAAERLRDLADRHGIALDPTHEPP